MGLAGTVVFPGPLNSYIPDHESTGGLIVDFCRNPNSFPLNRYIKNFPCPKMAVRYARFGINPGLPELGGRVVDTGLADDEWADGADAPDGAAFEEHFQYVDVVTHRKAVAWRLGYLTAEQASWDLKDQKARLAAMQMMTRITQSVVTMLTTSANYPTGHTSAVSAISGNTGTWDASTSARQDIRRSIHTAVNAIRLDTLGVVRMKDLVLVMSPSCASKVARSQEIVDYLKQQAGSINIIRGEGYEFVDDFELPSRLYGIEVQVEDTVRISSAIGATRSAAYVLGDDKPFIVSRPGALMGTDAKAPNFSTASVFVYDQNEMLNEVYDNTKDKRFEGRVIHNYVPEMTAPAAAYLFTSAVN